MAIRTLRKIVDPELDKKNRSPLTEKGDPKIKKKLFCLKRVGISKKIILAQGKGDFQ